MMYSTQVAIPTVDSAGMVAMARVQHRAVASWWVGSWTWVHSYRRSAAGGAEALDACSSNGGRPKNHLKHEMPI